MDRARRVNIKHLFKYLLEREELEYKLASDETDPLVPGGCYRAPPHSRWNTPEFTAVFADTLRKIAILTIMQHMWRNNAYQWCIDIKTICKANVSHFEQLVTDGLSPNFSLLRWIPLRTCPCNTAMVSPATRD